MNSDKDLTMVGCSGKMCQTGTRLRERWYILYMNGQVKKMANKANPKDIIPLREALNMEIMINQALIDLLVAKGIITPEELMAKIEQIRKELPSGTS